MARQTDDSFVCFGWNLTKGFGLEISPWPEVEGDAIRELVGQRSSQAVGDGTWTRAVDTGHRSREASQHEMGSSDSEEDRVKMSRHSSCFVEFSLVIHASVSLYMLSEMQCYITPCLALELTPSVCSFVLFFLLFPRLYSCSGKEMCVTPIGTTSWSPAVKKWNGWRGWRMVGRRGKVTLYSIIVSIREVTGTLAQRLECSPMARETWVQSQVESYQRL